MKIYPVIHYIDLAAAIENAHVAHDAGADGVFLISHDGQNHALPRARREIQPCLPGFAVGVNFLGWSPLAAYRAAEDGAFDMVWLDAPGISSRGVSTSGWELIEHIRSQQIQHVDVFASVAFKYQPHEPIPSAAAAGARVFDLVPTTSGPATGVPPDLQKVIDMYGGQGPLAVASGMTAANVAAFTPYLSHILVATGVSRDDRLDFELLSQFVGVVRGAT